jgi:hypothetical protein
MRRYLTLIITVSAAIAAAGCGSTGTPRASVPATTTAGVTAPDPARAQFIAAADAICHALHAQQSPLEARARTLTADTAGSRSMLQALLRQSVMFARAAASKLQALPRPPTDAPAIGRLVTGYEREAAEVSSYADTLTELSPERQKYASGALEGTTASDRMLAERLGLKTCAAPT